MVGKPSEHSTASLSLGLLSYIDQYQTSHASGETHTARAKRLDIEHFKNFLVKLKGKQNISELEVSDWDFISTQNFVDTLLRQGESPATVARRLATLKHMGRILSERNTGFVNPARDVKAPRVQPLKPKALGDSEIEVVRERAKDRKLNKNSFSRSRNETIVNFFLDTGLRADEIRNLRLSQLDDGLEWIKQVQTKGRRFRNVYITSTMREMLKEYLALRKLELKRFFPELSYREDLRLPLFISTWAVKPADPDSFLMSPKSIWRAVRECSAETRLHPHLLRHTYATDLLESSRDVRLVAQALGHSDVRVTMRYTERADQEIARALEESRQKKKLPE